MRVQPGVVRPKGLFVAPVRALRNRVPCGLIPCLLTALSATTPASAFSP